MTKKTIYIFLFIVLGIIVSFLLHAVIEIYMIKLLVKDFDKYGLGLSWQRWYLIHYIGSIILFILGVTMGFWMGRHWWQVIYVEKRIKRIK